MEDLKPSSREEAVLAKIAGIEDPMVDAFEPSSREEWFMNKIAEKMAEGGGGSGGGGTVFVDCTLTAGSQLKAEKTAGEIFEAVESGLVVIFKFTFDQVMLYMHCFSADNMDGYHFAVAMDEDGGTFRIASFDADTSSDNPTYGGR